MKRAPDLPAAVTGELRRVAFAAGDLNVYVEGQGAPLLLIHSINAAASAAEVRPLHEHFPVDATGIQSRPSGFWSVGAGR